MKKIALCLVILFLAAGLYAAPIQLGSFPVGKWLDSNYDAVWDFSTNNIRILSPTGTVLYDFSTKTVENFGVFVEGTQPGISFACPEAGRTYRFIKPLSNSDVVMEITRQDTAKYTVTMKKQ